MNIFCDINLWGIATKASLEEFFWARLHDFSYTIDSFLQAVDQGKTIELQGLVAREVDQIDTALLRTGLGYCLQTHNAVGAPGNILIWDPIRKERHAFTMLNHRLHLPVDILDCPERMERARRGRSLFEVAHRLPFGIADTAHETLELITERPEIAPLAGNLATQT